MKSEAGVAQQPAMDLGCLVGRGVVDHHMDVEVFGHAAVDQVQETSELEGAVALGHVGDDLARGDVECGVEIGGAASHVVVGAPFG